MGLLKRSSPYFSRVFCPKDGFSKSVFALLNLPIFLLKFSVLRAGAPKWLLTRPETLGLPEIPQDACKMPEKMPPKCPKIPFWDFLAVWGYFSLVTRPKYPPPHSPDRCSNTPVALCFLWYRRLSLPHPPLLSVKMAYRSPKTGLGGGGYRKKSSPLRPIAL